MIAFLTAVASPFVALYRLLGLRGVLIVGAVLAVGWWHLSQVSAAREEGAQGVRLEWAEARQRAEIEQARKIQKQQEMIDAAEAALVDAQAAAAIRQAELEDAIARQETGDANTTDDGGAAARSSCPPIPEGVRNALNRIGR